MNGNETENPTDNGDNGRDTGDDTANNDPIAKANEAAERLERANAEMADLLKRADKQKIDNILGGKSEISTEKPKELTDHEYRQQIEAKIKAGLL